MKQEGLEKVAENYGWRIKKNSFTDPVKANELAQSAKEDFIEGARWQSEKILKLYDDWETYNSVNKNFDPNFLPISFKSFIENGNFIIISGSYTSSIMLCGF